LEDEEDDEGAAQPPLKRGPAASSSPSVPNANALKDSSLVEYYREFGKIPKYYPNKTRRAGSGMAVDGAGGRGTGKPMKIPRSVARRIKKMAEQAEADEM
jgi:hypothetical protein